LWETEHGSRLIINSFYGHVRIWDFAARRVLEEVHSSQGHRAWPALSPDGKRLAVYWTPQVFKLYDTAAGQLLRDLALPAGEARIFHRRS